MSQVNEFPAKNIKVSDENKLVYVLGEFGQHYTFPFTFYCRADNLFYSFDFNKNVVLIAYKQNLDYGYRCISMKFWIEDDRPALAVQWFGERHIPDNVQAEFKEKYAAYLLDGIIQS